MSDSKNIVFTMEMKELRDKVNYVRHGLGSSKTDLQVLLFRIEVTGNKAKVFAANKEMFARTEMKISRPDNAVDGTFSLLGNKLEKLISQVEAETVSFNADPENLEVQAGFLTVNFELYDGASLKAVEQGVEAHLTAEGTVLNRQALEEALACAKSCITTNSIRPDVTHAEMRGGRVLSSDGRKIMIYTNDKFPAELNFKVPATALNDVLSAVKNIDAENIQIIDGANFYYIKANLNQFSLGVRKVERTFPQVENQITAAATPTDEVSIDKNVMEAMLKGVALGLGSDDVRVQLSVSGTGSEAYLEVSSANTLGRRSHERASCGRKSEEQIAFPVSFKHLLDTLGVFKGDSVVDLMIMTDKNIALVRDTTSDREVLTVIPFRTDAAVDAERKEAAAAEEARKKQTAQEVAHDDAATAAALAAVDQGGDIDLDN